jgi:hypothetical protein
VEDAWGAGFRTGHPRRGWAEAPTEGRGAGPRAPLVCIRLADRHRNPQGDVGRYVSLPETSSGLLEGQEPLLLQRNNLDFGRSLLTSIPPDAVPSLEAPILEALEATAAEQPALALDFFRWAFREFPFDALAQPDSAVVWWETVVEDRTWGSGSRVQRDLATVLPRLADLHETAGNSPGPVSSASSTSACAPTRNRRSGPGWKRYVGRWRGVGRRGRPDPATPSPPRRRIQHEGRATAPAYRAGPPPRSSLTPRVNRANSAMKESRFTRANPVTTERLQGAPTST